MSIHKQFIYILLVVPHLSASQPALKKIKDVKSTSITQVTVDRLGNFFIVSKNNSIQKFDSGGKRTASLKGKNITLLEPWYHPTIFIYDQKKQRCFIYGRNFENEKEIVVDPAWSIEPTLIFPSNDNKLWLFDHADASIKKINPLTNQVILEYNLDTTQFKTTPHFKYLREYQNMIFLLDVNSGIIILNNIGKQINKIEIAGIENFNFFGEELYFLTHHEIQFFDLYTEEIHHLKVEGENKMAVVTDERVVLISKKNKISLFEFKPN
jgi:hypothetical protein